MGGPVPESRPAERAHGERLDSWKAIAAYLKRDVTTVQRWERREGMPVHRHLHEKRGSVYALSAELDAWRQTRGALPDGRGHAETPASLNAPESRAGAEVDAGAPEDGRTGTDAAVPLGVEPPSGPHGSPWPRRSLFGLGFVLLLLPAAPYLLRRERAERAGRPRIASLAVLPLRNLSGDPAQDYLADGMTEALIGRLARIRELRVVSRTSVMRFKNTQLSAPEIGRMLGADALVEGSVTRAGGRIRVTAQLIRAATDEHFWSETYDRELEDVLALESDLASSIAEKVEVTVTGAERERLAAARPVAPEVYESYLRGRFTLDRGRSRADFERSAGEFERAIRLDPTFAPAYVGLAQAFTTLGLVEVGDPPGETRPKVMSAARTALELDPDLAEAHVLLANTEQEQWRWSQAESEYRRALDLSPNDAAAHAGYALWLACQGRGDEALAWARRGRQLDPVAVSGGSIGWILFLARRYAEAVRELRSALDVQPNDTDALITLGFVLSASGREAEAVPVLERVVSLSGGSPAATGVLIRAYALSGRRADALRLLGELKRRRAAGYVPAAAFVNAYLGLGDTDSAFRWLEQAYTEQSNILQFLKVHPFFDPIRNDRRFADLVRRVWSRAGP